MKKILFLAFALSTFASDVEIYKYIDEMTDEVSYLASYGVALKNYEKGRGFAIKPYINSKTLEITGLMVKNVGFGCGEKDQLIILLDDGQKIKLESWNDFNCDGNSYFRINQGILYKLKNSPLKKAMLRNGDNFKSLTQEFEEVDKDYFIRFISLLEKRNFSKYKD